jgi:alpha-amylase
MGSDIDYSHPEVEADVLAWGKWLAETIPLRGIRFDAIKHYSEDFLRKFIVQLDEIYGQGWFFVGEFWKDSLSDMTGYLERMGKKFSLFDAPLVYNFSQISRGSGADMRQVFDGSLVQVVPVNAVVCLPTYRPAIHLHRCDID